MSKGKTNDLRVSISFKNLEIQVAFRKGYISHKFYLEIKKDDSKDIILRGYNYLRKDSSKWEEIVAECENIKNDIVNSLKEFAVEFLDYGIIIKDDYETEIEVMKFLNKHKYETVINHI